MAITDELREWAQSDALRAGMSLRAARDQTLAIADRIDAEHEAALLNVHTDLMDASGWVRLPKDADGEYIHIGDKVYQVEGGWVYTVKSITFYPDNVTVSFSCKYGFGCDNAHNVRHYHEPTVEDVLHSFICDIEEGMRIEDDIIAEYAKRLRLVGDAE